jgi:hypothetical protein
MYICYFHYKNRSTKIRILFIIISVMKMGYNLINQLSDDKDNWKLRVRLSRMWNAINRKTSELISVDMVLIDENVRFEYKI